MKQTWPTLPSTYHQKKHNGEATCEVLENWKTTKACLPLATPCHPLPPLAKFLYISNTTSVGMTLVD